MSIKIISDKETKKERGYREIVSDGVSTPSDGMIEILLRTSEGECLKLWMTCKRARGFCDALNNSLLYHDEFGEQNAYVEVDRTVPGYDPKDYVDMQTRHKSSPVTNTFIFG
jgi:hypothetical protein